MPRPTQKQKRIKEAQALLENETLLDIFTQREREIYERWKGSTDPQERERCWYDVRALEELKDGIYTATADTD